MLQLLCNVQTPIGKTDRINQRLVTCISVIAISYCLCIVGIVACYFFSDYDYIDASQETISEDGSTTQKIKTGGE